MSGLILTRDDSVPEAVLREGLARVHGLELGVPNALRIPATLCTDDSASHQNELERLDEVAGVLFVDLVFHDFEDVVIAPASLLRRRRRGDGHGTT